MIQQNINVHILVVPFPYETHINGILRLAQALSAQDGVLVSFAYPERAHRAAHKHNKLSVLQNCSTLLVEVVDDGLPLEEEQSITFETVVTSIGVFQNAVKLLLHKLLHLAAEPSSMASIAPPPCCIISDSFCAWTQALADSAALPRIEFWTSTAATYSMGSQLSSLISNGVLPLPKKGCLPILLKKGEGEGQGSMLATFAHTRKAHSILVHSVYELESEVFDALQADGYPIQAVGPLLDSHFEISTSTQAKHECLQWLDEQSPSSVVYVALGSLGKLNTAEMHALALSLEASGQRFLWVIRQDAIMGTIDNILPDGFMQRTIEKGLGLIVDWAPQTEVLRHRSVGVFFSHCGWNSTMESIWEGVPMLACPRAAEQRSNARWIVEKWKIGVEVERQLDGSFTKEAVQTALKEVLALDGNVHKGQSSYKERALHAKALARSAVQKGGTSYSNVVSFCQRLCRSSKP